MAQTPRSIAAFAATIGTVLHIDEIVITREGIHDRHGFPWARRERGFRFTEVERVVVVTQRVRSGRSMRDNDLWVLHLRGGGESVMDPGELWDHAFDVIAPILEERGVHVGPDPSEWDGILNIGSTGTASGS